MADKKMIKIKYYRSIIGAPKKHKIMVKTLGFRKLNQVIEREDTPAVRGVVNKIPHLIKIIE